MKLSDVIEKLNEEVCDYLWLPLTATKKEVVERITDCIDNPDMAGVNVDVTALQILLIDARDANG